jgi:hypothetical protein
MNRNKALLITLFIASFSLAACSGPTTTVLCPGGVCGGGTGTVAVTMVADTLPANPSFLSFQVTIAKLTFTPAVGTATTVTLTKALTVDLMRLQTDTAFLGTFANLPTGQYTNVTLTLSGNAIITFLNDTAAPLSLCPASTICPLSIPASSLPVATISYAVSQNAVTGIGIDLNIANAVSIVANALTVNFANANVLSAFTLPRAGSNLAVGQLDLIEDFTGLVSLGSSSVTITSSNATGHGSLVASTTSNTHFDPDPTGALCPTGTTQLSQCVLSNQVASIDAVLNSDGTLSIREIEPLLATLQDTVEGTVVAINGQTQFVLIVTDIIPAAQGSFIGTLKIGDGLTVNLFNNHPFLVDTKGLSILPGSLNNFSGQTDTTAMHFGQTIAVHVTTFTAANGTTLATSNTDTATLRWSRFTSTPQAANTPTFNATNLPTYFGFAPGSFFTVQTTPGTPGAAGVTNFDGIPDGSGLNSANPVALRALFLENTSISANPALFAAKVRQH